MKNQDPIEAMKAAIADVGLTEKQRAEKALALADPGETKKLIREHYVKALTDDNYLQRAVAGGPQTVGAALKALDSVEDGKTYPERLAAMRSARDRVIADANVEARARKSAEPQTVLEVVSALCRANAKKATAEPTVRMTQAQLDAKIAAAVARELRSRRVIK